MYYRGHLLTLLVKNYANTPYMKKIFIAIIFAALFSSVSRSQTKTHFEYPTAPDSLATLQEKTSYIVLRFWDKADMKKLLNDTLAFNEAFADYVSFIPYASADSVKKSIINLTSRYKNDAKSTLKIVKAAEKNLFSAEAPFWADEQYMLFTKAALSNKKISAKDKTHYLNHVKMLNGSQVGSTALPMTYTTRHGAVHQLYDQPGEFTLLYIHGPECKDCDMISLRLETDFAVNSLSKNGTLKIVDIYTGTPDENWKKSVEKYPYEWEAGTSDDIGEYIDVRNLPAMYLLDKDRKIILRDMNINQALSMASAIYKQQQKQQ